MPPSIDQGMSYFADAVADRVRSRTPVSVTTHIDCDGIASGGILARALSRAGASFTVSAVKEFGPETVESLRSGPGKFHIIADLGAGMAGELDARLGGDWVVLDHHEMPEDERDNERVINSWRFGIDGESGVCGGGMSYLAARAVDPRNADMAAVAVVAALGDRQDSGERRSMTGRNEAIRDEAVSQGLLEVETDLLLVGRQTRPLADSLASTSRPFIGGLTWNRGACTALLTSAGIPLKDGGRWRVAAELTDEEKRMLVEAVARYAASMSASGGGGGRNAGGGAGEESGEEEEGGANAAADQIVGYTYTLSAEDERGFLRDAREFSTMLNSCGRIGRAGVGICICMGDRGGALREGETSLSEYRGRIRRQMDGIAADRGRTHRKGRIVTVNAAGIVPESMAGTIASLLSGAPRNAGMFVVLTADGDRDGTAKVSARAAPGAPRKRVDLGRIMAEAGAAFGGAGGGHAPAAGARVGRDKLDEFLDRLESDVARVCGEDSAS